MLLSLGDILTMFRSRKMTFGCVGLFLGAVGLVVLTEALKPKCPRCRRGWRSANLHFTLIILGKSSYFSFEMTNMDRYFSHSLTPLETRNGRQGKAVTMYKKMYKL
jgi:hypothetical protein